MGPTGTLRFFEMNDTPEKDGEFEHMFGKLWRVGKVIHNFGRRAQNVRPSSYGI